MTLSVKQNVENGEKNGGLKRNVSRCNLIGINFPSISLFDFLALTSKVKPWMIQSFLTFDSMDRILKCHHSLESC